MPGKRGGAAGKNAAAEDEPSYHWLVLGEGDEARRFALKPQMPNYLMGKLFAAKTLGDILELQAKVLMAAVDDSDAEALDEFLESGVMQPEDVINELYPAYSERPTRRSEHTSGGASDTTDSPTSSESSEPGDEGSDEGSSAVAS
jgi:hypothetical protein